MRKTNFKEFVKFGKKFEDSKFFGWALDSKRPELIISVSKKLGNAVERNRVKRVLRSFFKELLSSLLVSIFVVVKKFENVRFFSVRSIHRERILRRISSVC